MRNWILGVFTGFVLAFLFLFFVALVAIWASSAAPRVREATTLVLDLEGELPEYNPNDLAARLMQRGVKPTLREVLENIDKAAADSRITGILVRPRSSGFGWGKAEELRTALLRFRKSGKKLYCHLVNAGLREYYVATACEKIYMQPVGYLDVKGMRAEAMFWKGTLDKIGADAELVHTGEYKTYSNSFTRKEFTPEHREMVNWLVDGIYGTALRGVAEARGKTVDAVRAAIEAGPYEPPQARSAGLVDDLLYEDQVFGLFRNRDPEKRLNKLSVEHYMQVPAEDLGLRGREKIAVVYAAGTIMQGDEGIDPLGDGPSVGSDTMGRWLRQAADDRSIKAVVLRVDSPGGDALASDNIWREVINLKQKKPVVVSMSDVAASGGYWISLVGSPIVADTATLTASVGVVYGKVNIHALYDKLGITKDIVARGPNALIDSDYAPYTPEQRQRVQQLAEDLYQEFVRRVATSRGIKGKDVDAMARGRVFTGEQARQKGLVDELGGLERAVELAKQKAGIARDERVQVVPFPVPRSLFELLLERGQSASVHALTSPAAALPGPLRQMLALRLFQNRPLALMPFRLDFR